MHLVGKKPTFDFISQVFNLIDIRDQIIYFDNNKIIDKVKDLIKNKDNATVYKLFSIHAAKYEKKMAALFDKQTKIEKNDWPFLMRSEKMHKISKQVVDGLLYKLLISSNKLVKNNCLSFLDIFSVGNLALASKKCNTMVSNYNIEKVAKRYCKAIFENSNLYENKKSKLVKYSSFLNMFSQRPRIRFSGIYYSIVKMQTTGFRNGMGEPMLINSKCYRFYRFAPTGQVIEMSSPYCSPKKIEKQLKNNEVNYRQGRFTVDANYMLTIKLQHLHEVMFTYKFRVLY